MENTGYLGTGVVFVTRTDTGGTIEVGNTTTLSISPKGEKKSLISNRNDGTAGLALQSHFRKQEYESKMIVNQWSPRLFAIGMLGVSTTFAEASGTVTNEAFTTVRGTGIRTAKGNISAVSIDYPNATGGSGFTLVGAHDIGDTTLTVDGTTSGTMAVGDVIRIGGASGYCYKVTALSLTGANPNTAGTVTIEGGLLTAHVDGATLTHVATAVLNTDYTIGDADVGFIKFTEKMPNAVAITVDYTNGGITADTSIDIGTLSSIPVSILLKGTNDFTGANGLLDVYQARLMPTGEFNWFSDEPQTLEFDLSLEIPEGKTTPANWRDNVVYA
jgi:hypothetical protein